MRSIVILLLAIVLSLFFSQPVHSDSEEDDKRIDQFLSMYDIAIMKTSLLDERAKNLVKEVTLTALDVSLSSKERENMIVEKLMSSKPNAKREVTVMLAKRFLSLVEPWEELIAGIGMDFIKMCVEMGMSKEFMEGTKEERKKMIAQLADKWEYDMEKNQILQKNTVPLIFSAL